MIELRHVARELLPQRERGRVLQVRAADLHDLREGCSPPRQRAAQCPHRGLHAALERDDRRNVHRRGKSVVGGLPLVDVVVGMHEAPAATAAAQELRGAVCEHLVDVHVGLRARARLPDDQRKMLIQPTAQRLIGGLGDRPALSLVENPERHVGERGRLLDQHLRVHHFQRHRFARKPEVVKAPLGLRTPQPVGRHRDRPHGVALDPHFLLRHKASQSEVGSDRRCARRRPGHAPGVSARYSSLVCSPRCAAASTTVSAVMLTMRRTVAEGVRI